MEFKNGDRVIDKKTGKKGIFTSDCHLFPNFKVECKIKSIEIKNGEILFQVIAYPKNKNLTIGGNMSNLTFEF